MKGFKDMKKFLAREYYHKLLLQFLFLVAAEYDVQKECFGTETDLAYDISEFWENNELDLYLEYQRKYADGFSEAYGIVLSIIDDLAESPESSEIWKQEGMRESSFWVGLRRKAINALTMLNERIIDPREFIYFSARIIK